jgi:hypothetical protein
MEKYASNKGGELVENYITVLEAGGGGIPPMMVDICDKVVKC